jgi:hypothetical protein
MNLNLQMELFAAALEELERDPDLVNQVLEISCAVDADEIDILRYDMPLQNCGFPPPRSALLGRSDRRIAALTLHLCNRYSQLQGKQRLSTSQFRRATAELQATPLGSSPSHQNRPRQNPGDPAWL